MCQPQATLPRQPRRPRHAPPPNTRRNAACTACTAHTCFLEEAQLGRGGQPHAVRKLSGGQLQGAAEEAGAGGRRLGRSKCKSSGGQLQGKSRPGSRREEARAERMQPPLRAAAGNKGTDWAAGSSREGRTARRHTVVSWRWAKHAWLHGCSWQGHDMTCRWQPHHDVTCVTSNTLRFGCRKTERR